MNEFTTEKGTKLFWEINYDLGGMNYFTGKLEPRGYELSIKRSRNTTRAFSGLNEESGAVRMFLHEVTRKSKKGLKTATEKADDKLIQSIADRYGI